MLIQEGSMTLANDLTAKFMSYLVGGRGPHEEDAT